MDATALQQLQLEQARTNYELDQYDIRVLNEQKKYKLLRNQLAQKNPGKPTTQTLEKEDSLLQDN